MNYSKIAEIRKKKRITQEKLAEQVGLSRGHLHKIENGANTTVDIIEKLSEVLEVPICIWWEENQGTVEKKPTRVTERTITIDYYEDMIEELRDDKRRMKERIDQLEALVSGKSGSSKAAG
jgi:transcriptional regulator with XRE-family HTH domain